MKKLLTILVLCVLFFILDNTLVPFFEVRGFYPSLLMLFIILYSIVNGSMEGVWLGAFAGILQDLYFINGFGINAFANVLVCALAGLIGVGIFKEKSFIPVVSAFGLTFLKGLIVFSILFIVKSKTAFDHIFYNSVYSMIVSTIMYRWVYRLCQKEYMQRRWSFYDK